jgi:hypothetical protein
VVLMIVVSSGSGGTGSDVFVPRIPDAEYRFVNMSMNDGDHRDELVIL